jgi:hypothetical protein
VDQDQFDRLTIAVAQGASRRTVLRLAGSSLAPLLVRLGLGSGPTEAAKRRGAKAKNRVKNHGHGGEGVQSAGRPGAAHKQHHKKHATQRKRRKQRRQQGRQQDREESSGTCGNCAGACCDNDCCSTGQVCNHSVIPHACCTPEAEPTTCAGAKCGEVIDNCGEVVDCGGCPPEICQTATCSGVDHHCHYTIDPDRTLCVTGSGGSGICIGGQCVVGDCQSNADCEPTGNTCTDHTCTCGSGPTCSGPSEQCCGDTPGGTCMDVLNDPNHCGSCGSLCEGSVCVSVTCVGGQCHFAQAPDNTNPGGLCPGSEVCCGGNCTDVDGNVDHCGTCDRQCANPTPVCSEDGTCVACQADAQCRHDEICCNGDCVDGSCRPTLCPCTHDDQCCRGLCEGGGPDSYYCCLEPFESCTSGFECCEGVCESGVCG